MKTMTAYYFVLSLIVSCLLVSPSYGGDVGGALSREQAIDIAARHLIGKPFDIAPPSTVIFANGKYTVSFRRPIPGGAMGETYTSRIVFDAKTLEALEIEIDAKPPDSSATVREFAADGFRGVRWKSDLSERQDMAMHNEAGKTAYYTRHGEPFKLGNGELINFYYGSYRKQFYMVLAQFRGSNNREKIKYVFFREFGKPFKPDDGQPNYTWAKGDTTATLMYDEQTKVGTVIYSYDPIDREVNRQSINRDERK